MTKKQFLTLLMGALGVALVQLRASAAPISGGISWNGNVTIYTATNPTGSTASDFTQAHCVNFGPSTVVSGATGSFSNIPVNTLVGMLTNGLVINPVVLPGVPLWTVGQYSFRLSSVAEPFLTSSIMDVTGVGVISDGVSGHASLMQWVSLYTSSGSTFSWNCSSSTVAAPILKLIASNNNAVISWPSNSTGLAFSLQTTTNLDRATNWVTMTNVPAYVGTNFVVTTPITSGRHLYRLIF